MGLNGQSNAIVKLPKQHTEFKALFVVLSVKIKSESFISQMIGPNRAQC